MTDPAVHSFSIIKRYLSPNSAVTGEGHTVTRQDRVFLRDPAGWVRWVACPGYDNHFIYKDPEFEMGTVGKCATMCTCGSMAVIVGYNAYRKDASPALDSSTPGELLVCFTHAQTGKHADGSS